MRPFFSICLQLLKIVDSLERIEFYDLLPAEKLQVISRLFFCCLAFSIYGLLFVFEVMVALFYKALCSDALDDFIEEKMEKWKELMSDLSFT